MSSKQGKHCVFSPAGTRVAAQRSKPELVSGEANPSAAQDVRPRGMQI